MGVAEDRISELPESLIHHILSFLSIKCIASTTILSKRWNNLWLSLPILDFTNWRSPPPPTVATPEHHNEEEVDSDSDEDSEQDDYRVIKDSPPVDLSETNWFMDFLDKVLFLDNLAHVKKFRLKTDSMYFDQDRVKKWINSIVMRDVEELILYIKCSGPRVVPLELFYCESLTVLDLRFQNRQVLDQSSLSLISFQRLKRLRLSFIEFKDKTLAMQVFSNCPVLEDLCMSSVSWKGLDVICLALPQLKFFTIRGFGRESIENVKVKFETPNLLSLTWLDHIPKEFIVDSFPCLVEAGIRYNIAEGYTQSRYDSLYKFVQKVSHVKHLMVSHTYFRPKILDDSSVLPRSYHTFSNLVSFEVDVIYYGQIGLLFDIILQFSPNLASLIFHKLFWFHELHEDVLPFNIVPSCLLISLKSIEFRKFYGCPEEMEVVKLFVESARVLQTITLGSSSHHLEHLNKKKPTAEEVEDANDIILEQLQTFSWASADCSVKFLSP
ncbi:hypothetical protein MKW92_042237 [Papaver armeniacum]|nr:hypothetical protein MKW92_042237 [Papaver armeniacum]